MVESSSVIVNEILCYISNKIGVVPAHHLQRLCCDSFEFDEINDAKKILYEHCAESGDRYTQRQGNKKKEMSIDDMFNLFQKKGNAVPVFAAVKLERLPPVSIDNIDVANLLKKIQNMNEDIKLLKEISTEQIVATQSLKDIASDNSTKIDVLEKCYSYPKYVVPETLTSNQTSEIDISAKSHQPMFNMEESFPPVPHESTSYREKKHSKEIVHCNPESNVAAGAILDFSSVNKPPQWHKVQPKIPYQAKMKKTAVKIGSSKSNNNLKVVKKLRYANIFVSRFTPEITESNISTYVQENFNILAKVTKVKTRYDTYSSFHVNCQCEDPEVLIKPDMWPDGTLIKWWRRAKNKIVTEHTDELNVMKGHEQINNDKNGES